MPGEDWASYELQPAPRDLLCQFRRQDGFAFTGYAKDFFPEFNVAGLEWKLTGIAKEQLERMPPEVRVQVTPQGGPGTWAAMLMGPVAPLGLLFHSFPPWLA